MFRDDVLCVGSAVVDRFMTVDVPFSALHLGDKILVKSTETHSGGGATNSAAALSLLGLRVSMLTKLGQDPDAEFVAKDLKKYSVRNLSQHHSKHATDFSTIIFSTKDHDRIIFTHKGASQDLNVDDFKLSPLSPQWIYLASLVGKSFAVGEYLANYALKTRTKLLFNPSLYVAQKGMKSLRSILLATSILVLNKEEAQALVGRKMPTTQLLTTLNYGGPETVVITDGEKMVYALHQGKMYSVLPPKVKVVETTGAGDAFASGLLAGIIKRWSFEDSLCLGLVNAASVLQDVGAKNKLLTEQRAKEAMKKYRIKIKTSMVSCKNNACHSVKNKTNGK